MTTRHIIGYLLLLIMLAAGAVAIRWAVYNSERNVRRRERRARRARYKAQLAEEMGTAEQRPGPTK